MRDYLRQLSDTDLAVVADAMKEVEKEGLTAARHVRGDISLGPDNMLGQIAESVNILLGRLQQELTTHHQLQHTQELMRRTEEEIARLGAAVDDLLANRLPIWPALTGTPADILISRLQRLAKRIDLPHPHEDEVTAKSEE